VPIERTRAGARRIFIHRQEAVMSTQLGILQGAYEAFGRGDIDAVMNCIAEEVDWRVVGPASVPFGGARKSRKEVAEYFRLLSESDDVTEHEVREVIDAGDYFVVLGYVKATVRATGKPFETEWVHIITMKDGQVTRWLEFFDTAAREC
jgi:ketosteroid isomerase-like protein